MRERFATPGRLLVLRSGDGVGTRGGGWSVSVAWLTFGWHGRQEQRWSWTWIVGHWTRGIVVSAFGWEVSLAFWGGAF